MKKIIATVLSLITLLLIGSTSVFALPGDNKELNLEKCTKTELKTLITEERRSNVRKAYIKIKEKHPEFTARKIHRIIGDKFNLSESTIRRYTWNRNCKEYYSQYYRKNKKKYDEYRKNRKERESLLKKQYCKTNKEEQQSSEKDEKLEELEKVVLDYQPWDDFFVL